MTSTMRRGLTIPEPAHRPGDEPDFRDLVVPEAGATRKPAVDEPAESLGDVATGLVRVLADSGEALGPWAGDIDPAIAVAGLRTMLLVRKLDQKLLTAQRQGKASFYIQCTGEEAIATGVRATLRDGDMSFPTYRQQGLLVAAGYPLERMMGQVLSNDLDPAYGRQLPILYTARDYGYFTSSGNVATQVVNAVGWAMAVALKGEDHVTSGWIGDGATAEGDFYAGLLFASTYNAPLIVHVVNNQWAISTFSRIAQGTSKTFAARALGFGIPALRVDGNDYLAVYAAARWAAERTRQGLGPTVIEWLTYRVGAHSTSDDPAGYRPKDEARAWPLGDPIERLHRHLLVSGTQTEQELYAVEEEAEQTIRAAYATAEAHGTLAEGTKASPARMFDQVFGELPPHLRRQRQKAGF